MADPPIGERVGQRPMLGVDLSGGEEGAMQGRRPSSQSHV